MGDRASHRKALEMVSNNSLLNHILAFLLVCPMSILESVPEGADKVEYYQVCFFEAMLPCMVTSNEQVRRAAVKVEDRIYSNPAIMDEFNKSEKVKDFAFKQYVWTLT